VFAVFRRQPLKSILISSRINAVYSYVSTVQRLPAIKWLSRNSPAQLVALQDGATSLHVYASPAPRRDLGPSPLGSLSCRGALHISAAQKARFVHV
jgi:hypothetical protein